MLGHDHEHLLDDDHAEDGSENRQARSGRRGNIARDRGSRRRHINRGRAIRHRMTTEGADTGDTETETTGLGRGSFRRRLLDQIETVTNELFELIHFLIWFVLFAHRLTAQRSVVRFCNHHENTQRYPNKLPQKEATQRKAETIAYLLRNCS